MTSLKVLNLNGGGGQPQLDTFEEGITRRRIKDQKLVIETLYHDWNLSPLDSALQNCQTFPLVSSEVDLSKFENLEFLSMKNNQLKRLPVLQHLKNLTYLNIENNNLGDLENFRSNSLQTLLVSDNEFDSLPRLDGMTVLLRADFSSNDIQSVDNIVYFPETLKEIILSNNLIRNLGPLRDRFPADGGSFIFRSMVELSGNPIGRNSSDCPIDGNSGLASLCADYLAERKGNILDLGQENSKFYSDFNEYHQFRKCGVTTADI